MENGPLSELCSYVSYDSVYELSKERRLEHMTDTIIDEYSEYYEEQLTPKSNGYNIMPFNPKYTITPKINKALVEIERVRGFLDEVKLKDDWIADMQKKALIIFFHPL